MVRINDWESFKMKRSEMVNKIIEVLNEVESAPNDIKARAILAMQMECTMLPPAICIENRNYPDLYIMDMNGQWIRSNKSNEWDLENES